MRRAAIGLESSRSAMKPTYALLERRLRLILLKRSRLRREGSLAAALTQSMALAVIGTAGAYPSWVVVKVGRQQMVLGASWPITRMPVVPNAPLVLGREGPQLMTGIALCCVFSVVTGSLALMLDFVGCRRCRMMAPTLHGLTAMLIACTAALGSCLLALIRGNIHTKPELAGSSTMPGQSLFLAFLACTLASTATGLSCTTPARVQPARSSWDFGNPWGPRLFHSSLHIEKIHDTTPATPSQAESSVSPSVIISTQEARSWRPTPSPTPPQPRPQPRGSPFPAGIPALREDVTDLDFAVQDYSSVERLPSLVVTRPFPEEAAPSRSHSVWPHPSLLELARSSLERCIQPACILDPFLQESEAALPRYDGELSLVRESSDTDEEGFAIRVEGPEPLEDQSEDSVNLGKVTSRD